jgi:hypothetical protein
MPCIFASPHTPTPPTIMPKPITTANASKSLLNTVMPSSRFIWGPYVYRESGRGGACARRPTHS